MGMPAEEYWRCLRRTLHASEKLRAKTEMQQSEPADMCRAGGGRCLLLCLLRASALSSALHWSCEKAGWVMEGLRPRCGKSQAGPERQKEAKDDSLSGG